MRKYLLAFALVVCVTRSAGATIAFVDAVSTVADGAGLMTVTAPMQNVAAGNFLLITVMWNSASSVTSCTDTALDTNIAYLTSKNRGDGFSIQMIYIWNSNGSAVNVVVCTYTNSATNRGMTVSQYSHVKTSANPLDIEATAALGNSSTPAITAFSTSNANDLIVVAAVRGTSTTASGGYTERNDLNYESTEDAIVSMTQSSITPGFTTSGSDLWAIVAAAFKDDTAGATVTPRGTLLGVLP